MTEDTAIFIDWENIYISTVTEYGAKPNVSAILEKAREYGRVVSATAYADWTDGDFRNAPPTLYSNGIIPRYISARYFPGGRSSKRRTNSIDVMLAVECSDFLHGHPQVDTYVLVTGDGDFIPLVMLLRSRGKKVVVIGVSEATSFHLIESADDFISYASLMEEERAARAREREPKKKTADPYKELVRAVEALSNGSKTRVLGQVKQQMIVQLGSFDERNEGFKKFKDFVVEAERRGLVNTVDRDFELQVYLPGEEIPETPESDLATEEPQETKETAAPAATNGRTEAPPEPAASDGSDEPPQQREAAEEAPSPEKPGFDLLEDLTPYELRTICKSVADLEQPASFIEIFGSIRELDERGELELSKDEIREVIEAMLEAGYVVKRRTKPYKEAKADITFFALDRERDEVKAALNGA
ncbi:NYN domain-containing protein [Rubrobacter marinus]|uniref:NYN domain-containing protein n=1 Tax=Rubrobacter marinus TaxID=2653852 RepID=A0A6G8PSJ2_9ACTN|nr:NYN domain-containing protein [Rubrobacter marinus]QIN77167.1 NYN domain-containing protein [Rubrobacter marinus]